MNYFEYCENAELGSEARLAFEFWDVTLEGLEDYLSKVGLTIDMELCKVYYEALEEQCNHDLRSQQ